MLCAVIRGPSLKEVHQQLMQAQAECEVVELRLDLFHPFEINQLEKLCSESHLKMIFTLRSQEQGGSFAGSEEERWHQLEKLAALEPAYIDLEYTVDDAFLQKIKGAHPKIKLILSYHNFEEMPPLSSLLSQLRSRPADFYKIAVMVHSSSEALSLLSLMKKEGPNLLVMGLGPYGMSTRILSPIFGAQFVYASLENSLSTAPGQLSVQELVEIYGIKRLNPSTAIYGLIGDPLSKSIGYLSHNGVMKGLQLPAVYLNFPVTKEQLPAFIEQAKQIGMAGLSVTMPLKESILPLLDWVEPWAQELGAVNTLLFDKGVIKGFNTDGQGALEAIESKIKVAGKRVLIIGTGGAAKAIAKAAIEKGASVTLFSRNREKAIAIANELGCQGASLEKFADECSKGCQLLINATPESCPIDPRNILEGSFVMDLQTWPMMTPFLHEALKRNCTIIYGYELFINQAVGQFKIWFGDRIDSPTLRVQLNEGVLTIVA